MKPGLPDETRICFLAAQDPLLTQRANPTVSFVDVIVQLGRQHRCDKEARSSTREEGKTAHLLWVTVLSSRQTICAASAQHQPYLSAANLTGMTPPERL